MSRTADYAIQGFIYQFILTLHKVLLSGDDDEIVVEGIVEDIDIVSPSGTLAIYDGEDLEFIYPDIMIKIRVNERVLNKYLYYVLSSKDSMDYFKNNASGTAGNMPKINQTTIMNLRINLPILQEQTEIVRRVEALFSKADAIEVQYKKLKEQIDQLPQAILAKAFRGEV